MIPDPRAFASQVLVYAFLGSAQHISIGTIAVVDIMLRDMIDKHIVRNGTQIFEDASVEDTNFGDPSKLQVMTAICLLTGLCQIVFGLLHLGAVSLILSDQLISGFSCGAAVNVILSQVPTALEMKGVSKASGPLSLVAVSTCHTRIQSQRARDLYSPSEIRDRQLNHHFVR